MKMKPGFLILPLALSAPAAQAVLVSLNTITPGTETVALVANGGFELGTPNTVATSWTRGGNNAYYDTPANAGLAGFGFTNLPASGKVGYYRAVDGGDVNTTADSGQYSQAISGLDADTEYVLSAYFWNASNPTLNLGGNTRNLVMDMNDKVGEAQIILGGAQADAEDGYFVYQTFNTSVTGTSFTLRVFTQPDGIATGNTITAWDNIAITKAVDFVAPVPEPSAALLGGIGMLALLRRRRA
jgi:hypothetical protein